MNRPKWPPPAILPRCARLYASASSTGRRQGWVRMGNAAGCSPWTRSLEPKIRVDTPARGIAGYHNGDNIYDEEETKRGDDADSPGNPWLSEEKPAAKRKRGKHIGRLETIKSRLQAGRNWNASRQQEGQESQRPSTSSTGQNGPALWLRDLTRPGRGSAMADHDGEKELRHYGIQQVFRDKVEGALHHNSASPPPTLAGRDAPQRKDLTSEEEDDTNQFWLRALARPGRGAVESNQDWELKLRYYGAHRLFDKAGKEGQQKGTGGTQAQRPQAGSESKKTMLTIKGLSTNLTARDFYRIAPDGLSSWQHTIRKVQQQRDPKTFQPLGVYQLSFSTAFAAASYYETLKDVHRIAKTKLFSRSGLWQNQVPQRLHRLLEPKEGEEGEEAGGARDADPMVKDNVKGPDAFTLAPPSIESLAAKLTRISVKHPWQKALQKVAQQVDDKVQPPVVLLDVYPPYLSADQLERFLKIDEQERGVSWHNSEVVHLHKVQESPAEERPESTTKDDGDEEVEEKQRWTAKEERLKGRFLLTFPTDLRAARFHRSWNQRTLNVTETDGRVGHYTVSASIVRW